MYPGSVHKRARMLRRHGFTHREIIKQLHISAGSAWLWTKDIVITGKQRVAILERARVAAFTPARRKKLREWAKVNLAPYREHYTKESLLKKIIEFHRVHRRIPLKREFNMYHEYHKRFGSWNHAIRLAGFAPNPELFAHKFVAKDGHKCDSFTEKIIDDWLTEHRITHERCVPYPGTRMTADFSLGPTVVLEFFGLAGVQRKYDTVVARKRKLCKERRIRLLEVYPKDIFPKNRLADIIRV